MRLRSSSASGSVFAGEPEPEVVTEEVEVEPDDIAERRAKVDARESQLTDAEEEEAAAAVD